MVNLKLLSRMDFQINKVKRIDTNFSALFSELLLVILMGNFFQFSLVDRNALWDNKIHIMLKNRKKIVWENFIIVITFTKQMWQKFNFNFHDLFQKAKNKKLNQNNIVMLNQYVAMSLPSTELLNEAIIIQKNNIRHLVNQISVDLFANANDENIILFSCSID